MADAGETKIIKNSKGQDIEVKTLENGYALNDGTNTMNLVFDEKEQIWSAEYEDQVMNLIRLVDENNAQLFLKNGEVMDITLNADGIEAARLHMYDCLAMNE